MQRDPVLTGMTTGRARLARAGTVLLWLTAAAGAVRLCMWIGEGGMHASPGFSAAYTAARLVASGAETRRLYADDWFAEQLARYEPTVRDNFSSPPPGALIALPLAGMEYRAARWVWIGGSVAAFTAAAFWLLTSLGLRGAWMPGFVTLMGVCQPLRENLRHAQIYPLLFAIAVCAWRGTATRRAWGGGASLAALLATRFALPFLWLEALLARRFMTLAWGTAALLAIALATLPWSGVAAWTAFARHAADLAARPLSGVTAYQTLPSFARHLFRYDPIVHPRPLLAAPALAALVEFGGAAILLGGGGLIALRRENSDLSFAAFVIVSLVLSPFSLDYHYLLALLPLALLAGRCARQGGIGAWALLAVAYFLIAADLPYRSPRLRDGAWALLAYPKLYGALLLWGLCIAGDTVGGGRRAR